MLYSPLTADNPGYYASDDGRIWSNWKKSPPIPSKGIKAGWYIVPGHYAEIKQTFDRWNYYYRVKIRCADGKRRWRRVNRLVCEAFHGAPPSSRHEACHKDGDRSNNRSDNLYWGTPEKNYEDKEAHGTAYVPGRDGPRLTDELLGSILEMHNNGMSKTLIAACLSTDELNVTFSMVNDFIAGRTYKKFRRE